MDPTSRNAQELAYELAGEFITPENAQRIARLLTGAKLGEHVRVSKGKNHDFITLELSIRVTKGESSPARCSS